MPSIYHHPLAMATLSFVVVFSLMTSFVILGSHWVVNHVYAFGVQSWLIGAISILIGYFDNLHLLYAIALLTVAVRGLLIPYLVLRIVSREDIGRESRPILRPSSAVVVGAALVIFSLVIAAQIRDQLHSINPISELGLTTMFAIDLISFLMLSLRTEALTNLLGLLMTENGILIGSLILVPSLPFLLEIVILFDLIMIIMTFTVLTRSMRSLLGTTDLRRLGQLKG